MRDRTWHQDMDFSLTPRHVIREKVRTVATVAGMSDRIWHQGMDFRLTPRHVIREKVLDLKDRDRA